MSFLDDFQRMVHEYPEKTAIVDCHSIRQFEPAEYQEAEHDIVCSFISPQMLLEGPEYSLTKEYYDSIFKGCDTDFLSVRDHRKDTSEPGLYRRTEQANGENSLKPWSPLDFSTEGCNPYGKK